MTANELRQCIKEDIFNGVYTDKLPSISEFIKRYSVSHNTVKKALDHLKIENLIYGHKGKGCFVRKEGISDPSRTFLIYMPLLLFSNFFFTAMLTVLKNLLEADGLALKVQTALTPPQHKFPVCAFIGNIMPPESTAAFFGDYAPEKCIWINRYLQDQIIVCNDNVLGAETALDALYQKGHRHIGVLSCDVTGFDSGNIFYHRHLGVEKFSAEHPDMTITEIETVSNCADRENFIEQFHDADPEITGIFCFTDMLALRIAVNAAEKNLSVIGYDNRDFTALLSPPLTTVAEDHNAMAEKLCTIFQELLNGEELSPALIAPHLVERKSILPVD